MENVVSEILQSISRDTYSEYEVVTKEIAVFDIFELTGSKIERLFFYHSGKETRVAMGAIHGISVSGDKFVSKSKTLLKWIGDTFDSQPVPAVYGGIAFDPNLKLTGIWTGSETVEFFLPRLEIIKRNNKCLVKLVIRPFDTREEIEQILQNYLTHTSIENNSTTEVYVEKNELDQQKWKKLVAMAKLQMEENVLEKVVLARSKKFRVKEQPNFAVILSRLSANYPNCHTFMYKIDNITFFGSSPELLFEIQDGILTTMALAGTIKRGFTREEDDKLAEILLTKDKELFEHNIVVENIRDLLTEVSTEIKYDQDPHIRKLRNVQHLETIFKSNIGRIDVINLLNRLHPTPALGGKPKEKSLEFIRNYEPISRGYYASPLGWSEKNGDTKFFVAIRSGVYLAGTLLVFAGAGIVGESIAENEWKETELKFMPILEAIEEFL